MKSKIKILLAVAAILAAAPSLAQKPALQNALPAPYAAPEFSGIEQWLNSKPLSMQSLKGKVVLIDFWTYSCINCLRTLPYVTGWDKKYREAGLVIIGIHAPEFKFEQNIDNVKKAIAKHGIEYPVAIDNGFTTWKAYKNRYWPAHYLIDKEGTVVYTHFGEGEYDVTENNIRVLLGMEAAAAENAPQAAASALTPETYLGYGRAERFGGKEILQGSTEFHFPDAIAGNHWALGGSWTVDAEKIISAEKGAALRLNFTARKVFLVLGSAGGKPINAALTLGGKPAGNVAVTDHRLYELIDQKTPQNNVLEIISDAPGLEAYAFTFG
jgi:thiol-disulfide isomerase/thioredoxin